MLKRKARVVQCDDVDWMISFEREYEDATIHEAAKRCAMEFFQLFCVSLVGSLVDGGVTVRVLVSDDTITDVPNNVLITLDSVVTNPRDGAE